MEIENILLPTDFSEPANRALPHVVTLAEYFDSCVTLLYVPLPYADDPSQLQYLLIDERQYTKYVEKQFEKVLSEFKPNCRVSTVVSKGFAPALGILRYVELNPVSAVVMGTHGRSARGKSFLLGTVAEKVVRHARCPVLTVAHGRKDYRDVSTYKRILVPFDFSEHSIEALRFAAALTERYEATMQVLYVVAPRPRPSFIEVNEDLARIAEKAKNALGKLLDEQGLKNLTPRVDIGKSDSRASARIARFAHKNNIDLIVMASHGVTGIEHALLGSTTERVVRIATCPVLTVKHVSL